jgi:hypothetical protein
VKILCEFRDKQLATNPLGKSFIGLYQKLSPPIADFLRHHPGLAMLVRWSLLPVIGIAYSGIHFPAGLLLIASSLFLSAMVWCVRRVCLCDK